MQSIFKLTFRPPFRSSNKSSPPSLSVKAEDLGNVLPAHGAAVTVDGRGNHVVVGVQPDGAGWLRLVLEVTP